MKVFLSGHYDTDGKFLSDAYLSGRWGGMAIVMKGTHLCKTMRGAKANGQMTVAHLSGLFKSNDEVRREFYKLVDLQE